MSCTLGMESEVQDRQYKVFLFSAGGEISGRRLFSRWNRHRKCAVVQIAESFCAGFVPSHGTEGFRVVALAGSFHFMFGLGFFSQLLFCCKHFRPMLRSKQIFKYRNRELSWCLTLSKRSLGKNNKNQCLEAIAREMGKITPERCEWSATKTSSGLKQAVSNENVAINLEDATQVSVRRPSFGPK